MPERPIVLCASTAGPGGIYDYVTAMQRTPLWADWNVRHIATHRIGSQATKIAVFARATVLFAAYAIRFRPALVHLHAVGKTGSFSRNAILAWIGRLARVPVILHVHSPAFDVFYTNSTRVVRALILATLNRVDAVVALDETRTHVLLIAPEARVVVVPEVARLDGLYRAVSR